MAVAVFAADRRPTITISSEKNYKIVIDGKAYFGSYLTVRPDDFCGNRFDGRHSIKVFGIRRGFFGTREMLISSSSFFLSNKDIMIRIDWFGNIRIREVRNYRRYDRDDRYNNDRRYDDDDRRDRDFDRHDNDNGRRDRDYDNNRDRRF